MSLRTQIIHAVGLVVLVGVVLPFVVVAVPQTVGADHSYVVTSGSMRPAIPAGSMVVVRDVPPRSIHEGDVITFERDGPAASTGTPRRVSHRVVEVVESDGRLHFRTKGDANDEPDPTLVPAQNVVGRVEFDIPYLGYIVSYLDSDTGVLAFVVVPAVLLVVTELWGLGRALRESKSRQDGTARTNTVEDTSR